MLMVFPVCGAVVWAGNLPRGEEDREWSGKGDLWWHVGEEGGFAVALSFVVVLLFLLARFQGIAWSPWLILQSPSGVPGPMGQGHTLPCYSSDGRHQLKMNSTVPGGNKCSLWGFLRYEFSWCMQPPGKTWPQKYKLENAAFFLPVICWLPSGLFSGQSLTCVFQSANNSILANTWDMVCPEHSPDAGEVQSCLQYFAMKGFVFLISRSLLVCHAWQHVIPEDFCSPLLGEFSFNFVLHLFCSC